MRLVSAVPALVACLLVSAPWARAQQPRAFDPALAYRVPIDGTPVRGPADALITIVELSDFGCPYCGRAQATLTELERLYPGQLRVAYRHNPLDLEDASLAAEASMAAAAQGQFWPMHDRLYARFRRDLDQRRHLPRIRADADLAHGLGAYSTPTFFVNGRPLLGAQPLRSFVQVVEEELARARALLARGTPRTRIYQTILAGARPRGEPTGAGQEDPAAAPGRELDPALVYRVGLGLPGHVTGPDTALLTVIVFSDFQCAYCARLQPALQALRREYGDRVRLVLRHLPLAFHPRAQLAAEAAVAAAMQGKLWDFHDRVFAAPGRLTRADLEGHAQAIGLDMEAFRAALDDRRYFDLVAAEVAAAGALGVRGTPTMFVNGTPVAGSAGFALLQRAIFEPRRAAAQALLDRGARPADLYRTILDTADQPGPAEPPMALTHGAHGVDLPDAAPESLRSGQK
jgi:protein-disulfide isomerase